MKELVLQNIIVPKNEICNEESLYYRKFGYVSVDCENAAFKLNANGRIKFDTYFNSFSIEKWLKYTKVDQVILKLLFRGRITVKLYNSYIRNDRKIEKCTYEKTYCSKKNEWIEIENKEHSLYGIDSFEILTDDYAEVKNIKYVTYVDESVAEFSIALNMCTYKREEYIGRNIKKINEEIINNCSSELYNKVFIYITDNAGTLDKTLGNSHIKLEKQYGLGSTGGFTRGLINVLKDQCVKKIRYVIMMDDDIVFDNELIFRTYRFLQMVKSQYANAWLGASMLNLEEGWLQHEKGSNYEHGRYCLKKHNYDVRQKWNVVQNEIEENERINAWWYVAIPLTSISQKSLPYPMYFHCDDIEYALRNCSMLITLNGISVWHKGFRNKYINYYFDARNNEILFVLHMQQEAMLSKVIVRAMKWCVGCILRYRYYEAKQIIRAYVDFLAGPELLNSRRDRNTYETIYLHNKERLKDIDRVARFEIEKKSKCIKETKISKYLQVLTLNGWLLPARHSVIVSATDSNNLKDYYRAKKVINFDVARNQYYIETKDVKKTLGLLIELLILVIKLMLNYRVVSDMYRNSISKYISLESWERLFENANRGEV